MATQGFIMFRVPENGTEAQRDAWATEYLQRCNAYLGLPSADGHTTRAFTVFYERPDGSGGAAIPVDSTYASVDPPAGYPIVAERPDRWGLPPDDGDETTPDV